MIRFFGCALQSDPRYSNLYFNMSDGSAVRGPWNQGESSQLGEQWQYIKDPKLHVIETEGLQNCEPTGTERTVEGAEDISVARSAELSEEVNMAVPIGPMSWNEKYPEDANTVVRK